MPRCSGSADLPLHGGRVRRRLGVRMTRLGAVISQAIVCHYGRVETEASMSAIPNALIVWRQLMPVLILATFWYLVGAPWILLPLGWIIWRSRRGRKQAAWEAYIREECVLYIEEVLLDGR